jgi:3-methyl-2-oxobutanoate hydroxymethyltransferase
MSASRQNRGHANPGSRVTMSDLMAKKRSGEPIVMVTAYDFPSVLEAVPAQVSAFITRRLEVPVIGIGAGVETDGQVLVFNDLLGIFDAFKPKFVKRYAELRPVMENALGRYVSDVRRRRFPTGTHTYDIPAEELARFRETLAQFAGMGRSTIGEQP